MSAGLPVVAFDCIAGPSEMIEDNENGYLIPLFNYEMFQEKLAELMLDENKREQFGFAARKSIERFAVDNIGEAFFRFILPDAVRGEDNFGEINKTQ